MDFSDYTFRCSSLGRLTGGTKGLTENQKKKLDSYNSIIKEDVKGLTVTQESEKKKFEAKMKPALSAGAITYIEEVVDLIVYEIDNHVETDPMKKGNIVEDESIELVNIVYGQEYSNNKECRKNDYIQGECDIYDDFDNIIRDVKSSYTKETFPKLPRHIKSALYEWQGRGYMMLWDADKFFLDYCFVNTPKELIKKWENPQNHQILGLKPEQRVTTISFERDKQKEALLIHIIKLARVHAQKYYTELMNKNKK